jgi:hypothetical protein
VLGGMLPCKVAHASISHKGIFMPGAKSMVYRAKVDAVTCIGDDQYSRKHQIRATNNPSDMVYIQRTSVHDKIFPELRERSA